MCCQYPIPPTCYNWESTILCAGSQYCLTSTVHRLKTYNKYASVRHSLVFIYLWMWRWFEKNQPLEKIAKCICKVWWLAQAIGNAAGFFACWITPVCLNYVTFQKLYVIWKFSEEILILRICPLQSCTVCVNLDCLLRAVFIDWGFCCCFLDNHSRFLPELLGLCFLIKMYMLPLADLTCGNSINFCRGTID